MPNTATQINQVPFIGIETLQTLANKIEPNILLGPAYYAKEEIARLGINVLTGVQFMSTKYVFYRKGGTTRRKKVGDKVNNQIGFLQERPLITYVAWNHYTDNQGNYRELPIATVPGGAELSYPLSEVAIGEIGKAFSDDIMACLWWGDKDLADSDDEDEQALGLYDGFNVVIARELENGFISKQNGNLVHCDSLDAPADNNDTTAWKNFRATYNALPNALKRQQVLAYMSTDTAVAISDAYGNSHRNNVEVIMVGDTVNFKFKELPRLTVVPSDDYGVGERIVFTTPGNFEIGVNNGDPVDNFVKVKEGTDDDMLDIQFQIQTTIGTRVIALMPSKFAMTDAALVAPTIVSGDYKYNTFTAAAAPADAGKVEVSGGSADAKGAYAPGTTLSLKATANAGYKFARWSNGATSAEISVVTKNQPDAVVAIFVKEETKAAEGGTAETGGTGEAGGEGKGE